jgi:hypothetical protein
MFRGELVLYKRLFLLSILVLVSFLFVGSVGASLELWSQTYGGTSYETATAVIETSDGGLAIAGGTTSFGAGEYDFWLVKTDSSGNMEWNKTFGEKDDDYAYSLIETSDRGFALIGHTGGRTFLGEEYDVLMIKTDEHGNMEWNRTYDGKSGDNARCLIQTSDGGYAFAGYTGFSTEGSDYWLVKTDSNGNMEWDMTYALIDEEMAQIGIGTYNRASSLVETSDGGYAVVGTTGCNILAGSDTWLIKTDKHGNVEWNQTYKNGRILAMIKTLDEGFAMAGDTRSYGAVEGVGGDFWLLKTDVYGNVEWNQTYGGTGYDVASAIVKTVGGGFVVAGFTESFGAGARDFWLIKTNEFGIVEWNQTYGGKGYEDANSLVQTSDGGYVLAGALNSIYASSDWWIIKTDAQGIPEFPSWVILPLVITATLVILICKQRLPKTSSN